MRADRNTTIARVRALLHNANWPIANFPYRGDLDNDDTTGQMRIINLLVAIRNTEFCVHYAINTTTTTPAIFRSIPALFSPRDR